VKQSTIVKASSLECRPHRLLLFFRRLRRVLTTFSADLLALLVPPRIPALLFLEAYKIVCLEGAIIASLSLNLLFDLLIFFRTTELYR
jgi:hypothetical protein